MCRWRNNLPDNIADITLIKKKDEKGWCNILIYEYENYNKCDSPL